MIDAKWSAHFPVDPSPHGFILPLTFTLPEWPLSELSLYLVRIFVEKDPKPHFSNVHQGD